MANKIQLRRGTKAQLATLGALSVAEPGYCTDTKELFIGNASGGNTPLVTATSADITYYVRTDGSDSNTGLANTAAGAFKTINKAISMIPQILNHVVTINVASGSYSESVKISGKEGSAHVEFLGTSATIVSFTAERCKRIVVRGFTATNTAGAGFTAYDGGMADIRNCIITTVAASQPGINIAGQKADIRDCTISNRNMGIFTENGEVTSITNTGTGNVIGIYSSHSGSINKYGTQPNGTTPEAVLNGTITSGVLNPWGDNTPDNRTFIDAIATASQSISASVVAKVLFQTTNVDYQSEFSNSTFTAKKTGQYMVSAYVVLNSFSADSSIDLTIRLNGVAHVKTVRSPMRVGSQTAFIAMPIQLTAGTTLDICINSTSNGSVSSADGARTFISIQREA